MLSLDILAVRSSRYCVVLAECNLSANLNGCLFLSMIEIKSSIHLPARSVLVSNRFSAEALYSEMIPFLSVLIIASERLLTIVTMRSRCRRSAVWLRKSSA